MWSLPKTENPIDSVVIEILSFRQKIFTTLYNRKKLRVAEADSEAYWVAEKAARG